MKNSDKEINMETLAQKVGGRFKLTTLIQKRLKQLTTQRMFGQRKSDTETIDEVLREIDEGKIDLIPEKTEEPSPEDLLS